MINPIKNSPNETQVKELFPPKLAERRNVKMDEVHFVIMVCFLNR